MVSLLSCLSLVGSLLPCSSVKPVLTIQLPDHPHPDQDFPDISMPTWVETEVEFCSRHLGRLEGDVVSSHIHTRIDLTFGYKLSGSAVVRSKIDCLPGHCGHPH